MLAQGAIIRNALHSCRRASIRWHSLELLCGPMFRVEAGSNSVNPIQGNTGALRIGSTPC